MRSAKDFGSRHARECANIRCWMMQLRVFLDSVKLTLMGQAPLLG